MQIPVSSCTTSNNEIIKHQISRPNKIRVIIRIIKYIGKIGIRRLIIHTHGIVREYRGIRPIAIIEIFIHPLCVLIESWASDVPSHVFTKLVSVEADYQSGAFYLRELPCLLSLISDITFDISTVIVDGYVQLGFPPRPDTGERLYNEIKIPVIGVAKKYFKGTPSSCELFRGVSKHPFVCYECRCRPECRAK